jgi:predicted membrane protein
VYPLEANCFSNKNFSLNFLGVGLELRGFLPHSSRSFTSLFNHMFSIALLVASFWSTSNLNYVAVAVFGILLDLFLQIIKADIYIYIYGVPWWHVGRKVANFSRILKRNKRDIMFKKKKITRFTWFGNLPASTVQQHEKILPYQKRSRQKC